jgi:dTMP kinase
MSAGCLITFEGIEGCGKTTQVSLLADWLVQRGYRVRTTREPGGTHVGRSLRNIVLNPAASGLGPEAELFLYLADRAQNVRENITPALHSGHVVLCDRHADASVVYQGIARGLGKERVIELNAFATGGLRPARTVLLDLPAATGLARAARRRVDLEAGRDRVESEPLSFHEAVRSAYLELARDEPGRFTVVDASASSQEVHRTIVREFEPWLARRLSS